MKTMREQHNTTAISHSARSKDFDFNYIENDTALYCFFTNGKHSNNLNNSDGDKISVRNSTNANQKRSTLEEQKISPMRTTITTIELFDKDQPPSNLSSTTSIQQKSTLTMSGKISAVLSEWFNKVG
jgi:hypothetical protein